MTLRVPAAIAVGLSLIVLPVIIAQAQSEGEPTQPPAEEAAAPGASAPVSETVVDPAPDAAAAEPATQEADPAPAQEGSVLGEATTDPASSEAGSTDASAATSEPASTGDESAAPAVIEETASTTPADFLTLDTASSTASSTEPVGSSRSAVRRAVCAAAGNAARQGSSISAILNSELTCKACAKVLPAAQVKAYYTAWYPNDGEIKEVGDHVAEQAIEVSDVALWASRSMTWSATDIAPGRYYFVIVVDPENAIGAYRMQRMEFSI
jgi:hypothetical protein